jgi:glycosyltransferase involved in cell wall biosynthesis
MKLAIVINTSWNIYNFRMSLIKAFQDHGIQVYAIAPQDDYSKYLQENHCHYIPITIKNSGTNPVDDLKLFFQLHAIYKKIRPDIILHYTIKPNIYGSLAASLLKIPVINNVSGLGTVFLNNSLSSQIAINMYKLAFKSPKKVFFQNHEDLNLFLEKKLIRKEIADTLPGSGINLHKFRPSPIPENETFTFLLIARLLIDKGITEYAQAIQILRSKGIKAKFQLLGATDFQHKRGIPQHLLSNWVQEGIVDYLGTTDEVEKYIQQADCIILPSYREGTPRTLLEAASCGRPMIATNVAGCNNVVEDNFNGFLCNIKDGKDLADKMEKMYQMDKKNLQVMGTNSRALVEKKFDEKIVVTKYLQTIEQIMPVYSQENIQPVF